MCCRILTEVSIGGETFYLNRGLTEIKGGKPQKPIGMARLRATDIVYCLDGSVKQFLGYSNEGEEIFSQIQESPTRHSGDVSLARVGSGLTITAGPQ